jgi:heat shock protein HslJ
MNLKAGICCSAPTITLLGITLLGVMLIGGCGTMFGSKAALALVGTSWTTSGIADGKGGVAGLIAGSRVTLHFGTDDTLSGSAGCNNYTGRYEISGNQVRFPSAFASTRKMCVNPGVMDQEQAFLKALAASTTGHIDGKKLELRDAAGTLQITASGI